MEIVQKRLSNRASFSLGQDELKYSIKDASGTQTFSVEYASIPTDQSEIEERNAWLRNVGLIWVALGLFQIVARVMDTSELRGSIWLTLGLVCLAGYWLAKTKYTILSTDKGRIFIIQNGQHDQVMGELAQRRKDQWRRWYGEVNLENEPQKEIGKFHWLKEQQVISGQEFDEAVGKISHHHGLRSDPKDTAGQTIN